MLGVRSSMVRIGWVALLTAALLTAAGCSAVSKDKKSDSPPPPRAPKTAPVYHEFDDVLIPGELEIDHDESFIYQTAGLTVGILSLKGRVDQQSLIEFFEKNMPRDNWRMVSVFKWSRTMMLFQKQNRTCVLEISESTYYTYAKVWVAPTTDQSAGGLMK